jgi:uncharacterized cupredoxin-like copper-binding protein
VKKALGSAAIAVSAFLAVGCAARQQAGPSAPVVDVTVRDFKVIAPKHLPAGSVVLRVHNEGPDDHELVVVRTTKRLPVRADALTVDEDAVEDDTAAALEPVEPGSVTDVPVRLRHGRYEVFCNMSGHYMGGMSTIVTVG